MKCTRWSSDPEIKNKQHEFVTIVLSITCGVLLSAPFATTFRILYNVFHFRSYVIEIDSPNFFPKFWIISRSRARENISLSLLPSFL